MKQPCIEGADILYPSDTNRYKKVSYPEYFWQTNSRL